MATFLTRGRSANVDCVRFSPSVSEEEMLLGRAKRCSSFPAAPTGNLCWRPSFPQQPSGVLDQHHCGCWLLLLKDPPPPQYKTNWQFLPSLHLTVSIDTHHSDYPSCQVPRLWSVLSKASVIIFCQNLPCTNPLSPSNHPTYEILRVLCFKHIVQTASSRLQAFWNWMHFFFFTNSLY